MSDREREREVHVKVVKRVLFISLSRRTGLLQTCHQTAWLYLPAPLGLYVSARSSFALSDVCGPGPHGRVWRPQGASQELQPLLLQQLQSGKEVVMEEISWVELMCYLDVMNEFLPLSPTCWWTKRNFTLLGFVNLEPEKWTDSDMEETVQNRRTRLERKGQLEIETSRAETGLQELPDSGRKQWAE